MLVKGSPICFLWAQAQHVHTLTLLESRDRPRFQDLLTRGKPESARHPYECWDLFGSCAKLVVFSGNCTCGGFELLTPRSEKHNPFGNGHCSTCAGDGPNVQSATRFRCMPAVSRSGPPRSLAVATHETLGARSKGPSEAAKPQI